MTETKTDKTENPLAEKRAPKLARAAESGDPAVQKLLAEREIHNSNGDSDRVADTDKQLAELGFTAQ